MTQVKQLWSKSEVSDYETRKLIHSEVLNLVFKVGSDCQ